MNVQAVMKDGIVVLWSIYSSIGHD